MDIYNNTPACPGPRVRPGPANRKARSWPPPCPASPSAAPRLAERHVWQPQSWRSAHVLVVLFALCMFTVSPPAPASSASGEDIEQIGAGTLLFQTAPNQRIEAPRVHTDVHMEVSGIIARVEVRQQFRNPGDQWVEGLYAFPLPENAAVDRLHMQIGERLIVGEIREKIAAQQLYEQARSSGKRASLVQQHRPNLFRTSVANIGPHETISITIAYLQIVDQQDGRYSLRFPLTVTPRYLPGANADDVQALTAESSIAAVSPPSSPGEDGATLGDLQPALAPADVSRQSVSFAITVDAGVPLSNVKSAYHQITIKSQQTRYAIGLADGQVAADHDFELAWSPVVHGEPATALFRERTDDGEHLLLMFMPPQERTRITTPRELIFVVDTSGSMGGQSIAQARAALLNGLSILKATDRFNVIQFNSVFDCLFPVTVQASPQNVARAKDYVEQLESTGGTEMLPALSAALNLPVSGEYLRQIIFITDGAVGNEHELMELINRQLGNARLFTVGIGSAPNGYFMRKAAQMGRGTFTFIGASSEVDARMSALFHKLEQPALTDIELHWPPGVTPEYAPARIADLYSGEPVVVTARVQGAVGGILGISGRSSGAWLRQLSLGQGDERSGVATLWARNRVSDLMDQRAAGMDETAIRSQVLPLALRYQLVTQYTSLIAVDHTPARPDGEKLESGRVANTKPQGSTWPTPGYPQTATPADLQIIIGTLLLLFTWFAIRLRTARS